MNEKKNSNLTEFSQNLRNNMTKEESHLWYDFLKKLPITVNRQKVIGRYIVDFYCAEAQIVIELDGSQHYESKAKKDGCGQRCLPCINRNYSFEIYKP